MKMLLSLLLVTSLALFIQATIYDLPYNHFDLTRTKGTTVKSYYWSHWSECSQRCTSGKHHVSGIRIRVKHCHRTSPACRGSVEDKCYLKCDEIMIPCHTDCFHSKFADAEWTKCDQSCGGGTRSRTSARTGAVQTIKCNTQKCLKSSERCSADFAIILDASGSINELNWWIAKQFVQDVTNGLDVGINHTRVSLTTYSDGARVVFDLNQYQSHQGITEHIWVAPFLGSFTNTAAGIKVTRQMLLEQRRAHMKQIIVIITDGISTRNASDTIPQANLAKSEGVHMISVGITNKTSAEELQALASSKKYELHVDNYESLHTVTDLIREKTCDMVEVTSSAPTTTEPTTTEQTTTEPTTTEKTTTESTTTTTMPTTTELKTTTTTEQTTSEASTTTEKTTTITEITTPDTAAVDCTKCKFSRGLVWQPDAVNCHKYYVCDPLPNHKYRITQHSCGKLFWNQVYHTCVARLPANSTCNPLVTSRTTPTIYTSKDPRTTPLICKYEVNPTNKRQFRRTGTTTYLSCKVGMEFDTKVCTCVKGAGFTDATPFLCSSDYLIRLPFDHHLQDVSCSKVVVETALGQVSLKTQPRLSGKFAYFKNSYLEIPYMRGHFDGDWISSFSVTAFFRSLANNENKDQVLVANSDCLEGGNLKITFNPNSGILKAKVATKQATYELKSKIQNKTTWHHVAWVLSKNKFKLFIDGTRVARNTQVKGNMDNNDVAMKIGGCCKMNTFFGLIDEVRFYARSLTDSEVMSLAKKRSP